MANAPATLEVEHPQVQGTHHGPDDGHATHGDIYLVGHDGQLHPAHLQHHFVSAQQQFEAAKLGMWLFLVTEILLFGGMFVAYAIYRAWYPGLYEQASQQLDIRLGAFNTVVLLASSLTIAWAIRNAQMDNQKWLFRNLVLTILLASGFLVVKYFEYSHKFELGIYPGEHFVYPEATETQAVTEQSAGQGTIAAPLTPEADDIRTAPGPDNPEESLTGDERIGGRNDLTQPEEHAANAEHHGPGAHGITDPRAGLFFSIYYVMTGIHGVHILIGIVAISVLAWKARKGAYTSVYYTPVENVALYWHIVDVIWIFLFPLMYLI